MSMSCGRAAARRCGGATVRSGLFVLAIFLFMLAAGCAPEVRYSPAEIEKFPPDIQRHIREGSVVMGMTREQVRYCLGAPSEINVLKPAPDGKLREEWIYKALGSSDRLVFTDGKLTEVETSGVSRIKLVAPPEEKRP